MWSEEILEISQTMIYVVLYWKEAAWLKINELDKYFCTLLIVSLVPVDGYPFPFKTVQSNMPSAPSFSSSRRVPAVSNFISFTSSSTKGVSVYKTPANVTLTMSAGTKPPAEWSATSNERWKRGLTPLLWSACLDDALVSRQTDRWTGKDDQESRTGSIRVDSWPRLG